MRSAGLQRSSAARIGGAAVAMLIVAEVAVLLLSPSDEPPEPVPVAESDYFSEAELARADDYRSGQRWLLLAGLAVEGAVLVSVAFGRPAPVRRALDRLGRRPVLGAAAAGAGVSLLTTIATLPVSLISHERSVDVGLSTQSLGSWFWDVARSAGITAVLTAGGAALLIALVRRFPRAWPVPGAVVVSGLAVVFVWIGPVVLAPIYNKFEPLPDSSRARADVLELGREAGVDIGQVYRIDASRRSTALNAYVDGIGSTKRVVLYDNLLKRAARPELRSIVAHELGHVAHDDVPRGILYVVLVTPLGLVFARELVLAITRRSGADPASPGGDPRVPARPGVHRADPQRSRQSALARGRGERRRVRAGAHARSRGADQGPASARPHQPLRPGPARALQLALRHPPVDGRPDRRRPRLRAGVTPLAQSAERAAHQRRGELDRDPRVDGRVQQRAALRGVVAAVEAQHPVVEGVVEPG